LPRFIDHYFDSGNGCPGGRRSYLSADQHILTEILLGSIAGLKGEHDPRQAENPEERAVKTPLPQFSVLAICFHKGLGINRLGNAKTVPE
jgi:hypothetical protein